MRRHELFEFMASPVSSERPKAVSVREIAAAMRKTAPRARRSSPCSVPRSSTPAAANWSRRLIRDGFINVLFAGNALATHDIEQAFYGTSLGVSLDEACRPTRGTSTTCERSTRSAGSAASRRRSRPGSSRAASCSSAIKKNVPFVLAGSIRDDGPLPEVITDALAAQDAMRRLIPGVGFCLMVATTLHSIAIGNLLPAWVKVACVDINPATVTKLMDRGSTQTVGIVSDAEPFLRALVNELDKQA